LLTTNEQGLQVRTPARARNIEFEAKTITGVILGELSLSSMIERVSLTTPKELIPFNHGYKINLSNPSVGPIDINMKEYDKVFGDWLNFIDNRGGYNKTFSYDKGATTKDFLPKLLFNLFKR
jgi:hypothetical protein